MMRLTGDYIPGYSPKPLRGVAKGTDPDRVTDDSRWGNHRFTEPPFLLRPGKGAGNSHARIRNLWATFPVPSSLLTISVFSCHTDRRLPWRKHAFGQSNSDATALCQEKTHSQGRHP